MSAPCKCHRSFAHVTPLHTGHCCFFPASQTCHEAEVAEWTRERDQRAALNDPKEEPCSTCATLPGTVEYDDYHDSVNCWRVGQEGGGSE